MTLPGLNADALAKAEVICFGRAMDQWRASLKRPDLTEEDRVKGAIAAYQRQAFALAALPPAAATEPVAEVVPVFDDLASACRKLQALIKFMPLKGASKTTARRAIETMIRAVDAIQTLTASLARANERVGEVELERDEALRYASGFLEAFVAKYCDPVPGFKPLPDLVGVLTQIDNATTVAAVILSRAESAEARLAALARKVEEAREVIEPLANLDNMLSDDDISGEFFRHDGAVLLIENIRRARDYLTTTNGEGTT